MINRTHARWVLLVAALGLTGCQTPQDYRELAAAAGTRATQANAEIGKFAEAARLSARGRAHLTALLEEHATSLQLGAEREKAVWAMVEGGTAYSDLYKKVREQSDLDRKSSEVLRELTAAVEAEINAGYVKLVAPTESLTTTAKDLGELARARTVGDRLQFLLGFLLEVNKHMAEQQGDNKKTGEAAAEVKTSVERQLALTASLGQQRAGLPPSMLRRAATGPVLLTPGSVPPRRERQETPRSRSDAKAPGNATAAPPLPVVPRARFVP